MKSVKGAITCEKNTAENIIQNSEIILDSIIKKNDININHIETIFFSVTKDLNKLYPAEALRKINIKTTNVMCFQEMEVEKSLEKCIRVIINLNEDYCNLKPIYLKNAIKLRPDIFGFSIAIDGTGGSGKSTIAKELSKELDFIYIDTGAMYRAVSYFFVKNKMDFMNVDLIKNNIQNINIDLKYENKIQKIFLNDEDVTEKIKDEKIAKITSLYTSVIPEVREKLVNNQRDLAFGKNVIMDGRDIGSNVLPYANLKLYFDASLEVRAKRRATELFMILNEDIEKIKEEIKIRDEKDKNRILSPLTKTEDAIFIDTSNFNLEMLKGYILRILFEETNFKKFF